MTKSYNFKSIILVILLIFIVVPSQAQENIILPYRLFQSEKAETMTEAVPLVVFLHGTGERGNDKSPLVIYPSADHGCWDEAFSTPGLFKWLFEK